MSRNWKIVETYHNGRDLGQQAYASLAYGDETQMGQYLRSMHPNLTFDYYPSLFGVETWHANETVDGILVRTVNAMPTRILDLTVPGGFPKHVKYI